MATSNQIRVRTAVVRAQVIAFLNRGQGQEFTAAEIFKRLTTSDAQAGTEPLPEAKEVVAALKTLSSNKMISFQKRSNINHYYVAPFAQKVSSATPLNALPRIDNGTLKIVATPPASSISIDMVKSTGRIRVQLGGMVIEIGVVND